MVILFSLVDPKPYDQNTRGTKNSILLKPETAFNLLSTYFKNIEHRLNNECFISKKGPCDLEEVDETYEIKYFDNEVSRLHSGFPKMA